LYGYKNLIQETSNTNWYVYIIRCKDGSLYTGITTNVNRRFQEHKSQGSKTAKYLRGKQSLTLVCVIDTRLRSDALRLE
jgi:putative endonuclease